MVADRVRRRLAARLTCIDSCVAAVLIVVALWGGVIVLWWVALM
jgi:hypothetical protein